MANKENEEKVFTIEEINLDMVKCPAGSFIMGSPENEVGREEFEILHKVIISKAFYIGKYPVTQKQYKAIMGINPSFFQGDFFNQTIGFYENNPVENINWNNAKKRVAFLKD